MVGVNRTPGDGRDRFPQRAGLVESVRVDGYLYTGLIGNGEAGVDHRRKGADILMHLQPSVSRLDMFFQVLAAGGAATEQREVHAECSRTLRRCAAG